MPPLARPPLEFSHADKLIDASGFEVSLRILYDGSRRFWKWTNPLTCATDSHVDSSFNSISATTLLPELAKLRVSMRIMDCRIRRFFLQIALCESPQIGLDLNSSSAGRRFGLAVGLSG